MEVSVRDIEQVEFHDAWRGYNQAEVDDFLDHVVETVERLVRENDALRARLAEIEAGAESVRVSEEMMKKTLLAAQQTAEETIAEARAQADRILGEAGQGIDARKADLEASLQSLHNFESETKQRLRAVLEEQLRALDALTEHPTATATSPDPQQAPPSADHSDPPAPAHELLAGQPVPPSIEGFGPDAARGAVEGSADVLSTEENVDEGATDTSLFDFDGADEGEEEVSLDDFRPFDDEAALQGRRRRGLFRRRVDDWA